MPAARRHAPAGRRLAGRDRRVPMPGHPHAHAVRQGARRALGRARSGDRGRRGLRRRGAGRARHGRLGRRLRALRERGRRRRRHDRLGRRAALVRRPGGHDAACPTSGVVQWLAASRRPPALAALTPTITTDSVAEGWSFRGGLLESGFLRTWVASSLAPPELRRARRSRRRRRGRRRDDDRPVVRAVVQRAGRSRYWAARAPRAGEVPRELPALDHRRLVRLLPGRQPALVRRARRPAAIA